MTKRSAGRGAPTRRRAHLAFGLLALAAVAAPAARPDAQPPFPPPPPPSFSPSTPADVQIPAGFPGNPIAYFDDYSWRAFIAMVWPAKPGQRGAPDDGAGLDGPGPRVFETYRSNWETFLPDGADPGEWTAATGPSPCPGSGPNDLVLASFSKFEELGQADFGFLTGPLVAQNHSFTRYATGYNRPQYDHMRDKKLYLRASFPAPQSPNGAIAVKSAWIEAAALADPASYYVRPAVVMSPATGGCEVRQMALVGLHIVQKTPSRPQWIWTSFEHAATAPDAAGPAAGPFDFNDGTATPMPIKNPNKLTELVPTPPPNQVQRLKPVNPSTEATNAKWRAALKAQGSVWANYRLVMTQWPLRPGSTDSGAPANTFPGAGSDQTAFANVTMETYEQRRISTGCMACHDDARADTDFVWSVSTHAFPREAPPQKLFALRKAPSAAPALKRLKARLEEATRP